MTALTAAGLTVEVAGRCVCRGLDLDIRPGQSWAVLGRNGSGKTTLIHTLAGLRPAAAGGTALDGRPLEGLARREVAARLAVLFQEHHDHFPGTVLQTVLTGRHPHLAAWQWEGSHDLAVARDALAAVGMAGTEQRQLATLSGGERRRVEMAAVLAQEPRVMLLDEPTNHLDLHQQIAVLQALRRGCGDGRSLVMTLHDVNLAARFCDCALLLFGDGEWVCGKTAAVLTEASLTRLYRHPIRAADAEGTRVYLPR